MTAVQFLERAVSVTLQAGLTVAVTYWLCRATTDERTRCRLWSLCSLLLLADLAAAFLLPHLRLFQPWTVVSTTTVSELFVLERQAGRVVFVVWLCGAHGAGILLMTQSIRMLRFLRSCEPLDENLLPPLADSTSVLPSATVAGQRKGILLQSPVLPVPVCWQWHRPCIVLPSDLLSLSDRDLTFILRHEHEHLRTGHPLQVFLQRLVEHSPLQPHGLRRPAWLSIAAQAALAVLAMSVSVPIDVTASPRSAWSPWPAWSAAALHDVGVTVRDYEVYDRRLEVQDLIEHHASRDGG